MKIKRWGSLETDTFLEKKEYSVYLKFRERKDVNLNDTILNTLPKMATINTHALICIINGSDDDRKAISTKMKSYLRQASVSCVNDVFGEMINIPIEICGIDFGSESGPHNGFSYNDFRRVISDVVSRGFHI